ncbi:MAG: hypothetical protein ACLTKR_00140 [Clostridium sp.]|uniref:hypothetical protein n=1 Tax=Clostridium sp. TaxID=1506 RepID=UPI003994113B
MFIKNENAGCFTVIVILLINLSIGAWSISEILSWFGKSIPLIASVIIGLFAGEISIPIAIIGWVLRVCGVF